MTGLYNRRAFFKELERRLQRLTRDGGPGALIYLDLDNFKAINQHKGHRAGDLVLLRLRDVLVSASRPTDVVARLGSDEFAVWLEGADIDVAKERAEQLVTAAQYLAAESPNPSVPLCLSLGVAVHRAGAGDTLEELVARADAARQGAKHTGKNAWRFADMPVVGPITGREVIP